MADYFRHFCVAVRLQGKLAPAWVADAMKSRRKRRQELEDAGDDAGADAVAVDFNWAVEDGTLFLTDNGAQGNVEHVASFLRALIKLGCGSIATARSGVILAA